MDYQDVERNITKQEIEEYLKQLNKKLADMGKYGEMIIGGGAAMTMVWGARDATHDIDALFHPKEDMRGIIKEIANENNIREDWLNDALKAFLTPQMNSTMFKEYSNLIIRHLNADCMLATKLTAARDKVDRNDAVFLMKKLNIKNIDELYDLVEKYTDKSQQTPKSYYFIQEVYEVYRREINKETPEKLPSVIAKKQKNKEPEKASLLNRINAEKKNVEEYKKTKGKDHINKKNDLEL